LPSSPLAAWQESLPETEKINRRATGGGCNPIDGGEKTKGGTEMKKLWWLILAAAMLAGCGDPEYAAKIKPHYGSHPFFANLTGHDLTQTAPSLNENSNSSE
jgi:hypothetical protein